MNKEALQIYVLEGEMVLSNRTFRYGKLTKSPYVQQNLWFVEIPGTLAAQRFTCLVSGNYNIPEIIALNQHKRTNWEKIAFQVVEDYRGWDYYNECPWSQSPVHTFTSSDGTATRFGYSNAQSKEFPDHELWYVNMIPGHAAIVDKECLSPQFIERMNTGPFRVHREPEKWWRWVCISWCHVIAPAVGEGELCRGANHQNWHLDAPNLTGRNPPNIYAVFEKDEELSSRRRRFW